MKKIFLLLLAAVTIVACKKDDTDFSAYINASSNEDDEPGQVVTKISTIYIDYSGNSVTVTGDNDGYVTCSNANVVVNAGSANDSLLLVLSGSTTDGSLLVYRQKKYGILLNGVSINNSTGSALNNQCGKALYLKVADGTVNTLTDGTAYVDKQDAGGITIDQKGAFFSEGQVLVYGTGKLNVTGNCRHAFACDDYIVFSENTTVNINSSTGSGIKVNDGLWINDGTININVTANAARGIRCDSVVVVNGGNTTISTSGDCTYDSSTADYSSAACIKCDYPFTMNGGSLTMTSSGDGGKGINCTRDIVFNGGTLVATTTGDNTDSKPKAIKSDTAIIIRGGSFKATVSKSWACDNGYGTSTTTDAEKLANCITVEGTPTESTITKKSVIIKY